MTGKIININPESEQDSGHSLSSQLDQALVMEEHYRALLLFWKKRRQRLESQIPINDAFEDFLRGLFDANH